ncbi:MAG: hypothetical protein O2902_02980, partial [Actinobacteria bacterium]|nr:hypothetical protein [Actinomycetota bacterium]
MSLKKLIALWLLAIFVFTGSLFASSWQFDRHETRKSFSESVSEILALAPTPITGNFQDVQQWRRIELQGKFVDDVLLIRNRPLNGRNGFWVVSNFENTTGSKIPVLIGWISAQSSASSIVAPPSLPTEIIKIEGIARAFETRQTASDLPTGQYLTFDKDLLENSQNFFFQSLEVNPDQLAQIQPVPIP